MKTPPNAPKSAPGAHARHIDIVAERLRTGWAVEATADRLVMTPPPQLSANVTEHIVYPDATHSPAADIRAAHTANANANRTIGAV